MQGDSPRFSRYVALGDSSTEGLDDPDERGGYRGWADRLAQHVANAHGRLLYANLAVRGRRTRQVRLEQLAAALALAPDLCTVFAGTNDVVGKRFDPEAFADDMHTMFGELRAAGATVLTFTLPDLSLVIPIASRVAPRVARMNETIRDAASATGSICVDIAAHPIAGDPRLWSSDRLHANSEGHARIAAALAAAIGISSGRSDWMHPFATAWRPSPIQRTISLASWASVHLVPWLLRHAVGRSSGDGRRCKRPALLPVLPDHPLVPADS